MDKICLDTDFLVDALRGKKEAAGFLLANRDKAYFATTFITLFELYRGAFNSSRSEFELEAVRKLSERFELLNLSLSSVKLAGELMATLTRRGEAIEIRDLLIGTITVVNGFAIKTNNVKHFSRIPNLQVI